MSEKHFGSPKLSTMDRTKNEREAFIKSFFRKQKNINWAIILIFFITFSVTLLFSIFPIFSVKYKMANSTFDNSMEQKMIEDYYKDLNNDSRKDLPFYGFNGESIIGDINEELQQELGKLNGDYGVYAKNLISREEIGINQDKKFTAASLAKLFTVGAAYIKIQDDPGFMGEELYLKDQDRISGNGSLVSDPVGSSYTAQSLIEKMLSQSDNTAFALLTREVGIGSVEDFISSIGLKNTDFINNDSTPYDVGIFLNKVYDGEFLNDDFKEEMLGFMQNTAFEDRIPYYIPKDIKISHKIGTWSGAYSDAGIVFAKDPYIVVVMTENADEGEAVNAIRQISNVIYHYFQDRGETKV